MRHLQRKPNLINGNQSENMKTLLALTTLIRGGRAFAEMSPTKFARQAWA